MAYEQEWHTLQVVHPVRTLGRDALFLRGANAVVKFVPDDVAKLGRVSGTNRLPTGYWGMAKDRLAGAYMIPNVDGSRVRGSGTHALRVVADMYVQMY